jgi:hypothetical protein
VSRKHLEDITEHSPACREAMAMLRDAAAEASRYPGPEGSYLRQREDEFLQKWLVVDALCDHRWLAQVAVPE